MRSQGRTPTSIGTLYLHTQKLVPLAKTQRLSCLEQAHLLPTSKHSIEITIGICDSKVIHMLESKALTLRVVKQTRVSNRSHITFAFKYGRVKPVPEPLRGALEAVKPFAEAPVFSLIAWHSAPLSRGYDSDVQTVIDICM